MRKILILPMMFLSLVTFLGAQDTSVLKIGYIDSDPASTIAKAAPFSDFVGKSLSAAGIKSAVIVVAKDVPEMTALLTAGKVDVYIDTVMSILLVNRKVPLDLSFRRWKKNVAEYNGVFLAKKTSSINDLAALKGLRIGFDDPGSTSGRYLPQLMLLDQGYKVQDISTGGKPASDSVGYLFTGSSDNTPVWVMQNKIDVGIVSSNDYDEIAAGLKNNLKIIGETEKVPRQLITLRSNLPAPLKSAIKALLLGMDKSTDGPAVLKLWEKTAKIDELTPTMLKALQDLDTRLKAKGL